MLQKAYVTIGSGADSYFEYLLKSWIITGKSVDKYLDIFRNRNNNY